MMAEEVDDFVPAQEMAVAESYGDHVVEIVELHFFADAIPVAAPRLDHEQKDWIGNAEPAMNNTRSNSTDDFKLLFRVAHSVGKDDVPVG